MSDEQPTIAIVGCTGAVGLEALKILESRKHLAKRIRLYASSRSAGKKQVYRDTHVQIDDSDEIGDLHHDYVLLCSNADVSRQVHKQLAGTQSVLIDNSSAFRMDPEVPLIIPEVNGCLVNRTQRLFASPNCSTVMLLSALNPIREVFGIREVFVSTYQAVSGAGLAAVDELAEQSRLVLDGQRLSPVCFPHISAFNVFEHESAIDPISGMNGEETKMIREAQKIWNDDDLPVVPTCIRVPVERAHSQSIVVELDTNTTVDVVQSVLDRSHLCAHQSARSLTPLDAAGKDGVFVGRVRIVPSSGQSSKGSRLLLWICCDQLRKGAALNAIEIMELHHAFALSSTP